MTLKKFLKRFCPADAWDAFVARRSEEDDFEATVARLSERFPGIGDTLALAREAEDTVEESMWTGVLFVLMAMAAEHEREKMGV